MKKIGILSDTHGYVHPNLFTFFKDCHEIWHVGDIGSEEVLSELNLIAPVKAVFGNCDDWAIRRETSEQLVFDCEEHKVAMMHIGGKPKAYSPEAQLLIAKEKPTIFVCGHSHILRILNDPQYQLLFINPGAAGRYGIHTRLTFLRFTIDGKKIENLEVYDEPKQKIVQI